MLRSAVYRGSAQQWHAGFMNTELLHKEGGVWVGPIKGRLFKFDFPSAKFWVKIFFGGGSQSQKTHPPLL